MVDFELVLFRSMLKYIEVVPSDSSSQSRQDIVQPHDFIVKQHSFTSWFRFSFIRRHIFIFYPNNHRCIHPSTFLSLPCASHRVELVDWTQKMTDSYHPLHSQRLTDQGTCPTILWMLYNTIYPSFPPRRVFYTNCICGCDDYPCLSTPSNIRTTCELLHSPID